MTSLRSGSTQQYSANWGAAFGEKKTASTKSANARQASIKAVKKSPAKSKKKASKN